MNVCVVLLSVGPDYIGVLPGEFAARSHRFAVFACINAFLLTGQYTYKKKHLRLHFKLQKVNKKDATFEALTNIAQCTCLNILAGIAPRSQDMCIRFSIYTLLQQQQHKKQRSAIVTVPH